MTSKSGSFVNGIEGRRNETTRQEKGWEEERTSWGMEAGGKTGERQDINKGGMTWWLEKVCRLTGKGGLVGKGSMAGIGRVVGRYNRLLSTERMSGMGSMVDIDRQVGKDGLAGRRRLAGKSRLAGRGRLTGKGIGWQVKNRG